MVSYWSNEETKVVGEHLLSIVLDGPTQSAIAGLAVLPDNRIKRVDLEAVGRQLQDQFEVEIADEDTGPLPVAVFNVFLMRVRWIEVVLVLIARRRTGGGS